MMYLHGGKLELPCNMTTNKEVKRTANMETIKNQEKEADAVA